MSARKHHWRHAQTEESDPGRASLAEPLISAEAVVRELHGNDADLVAEAARNVDVVRGDITLPKSPEEATAMLAQFEQLRHDGRANL